MFTLEAKEIIRGIRWICFTLAGAIFLWVTIAVVISLISRMIT